MANLEKHSFIDFCNKQKQIRIPGIQRDYAEGRHSERVNEIRQSFLNDLIRPIFNADASQQLDFIYGYDKDGVFEPLDGQQRLTTLFLLHWFFRPNDNNDLIMTHSKDSILSYATRSSTIKFCNTLVGKSAMEMLDQKREYDKKCENDIINDSLKEEAENKNITIEELYNKKQEEYNQRNPGKDDFRHTFLEKIKYQECLLSSYIQKRGWFMWQWRRDPSIQSMLVVLDEICFIIRENKYDLAKADYNALNKITFHLLNLEEFNLGDELYVKMNARGKLLSSFDILKSSLEEEIQLQDLCGTKTETDWRSNVDGKWITYFWQVYCDSHDMNDIDKVDYKVVEDDVESKLKHLLQRIICVSFYNSSNDSIAESYFRSNQDEFEKLIMDYRNMAWKQRTDKTNSDWKLNFDRMIADIDNLFYTDDSKKWHNATELIDNGFMWNSDTNLWDAFLNSTVTRDLQVTFYAMVAYLRMYNAQEIYENDALKQDFHDWMHFIRNSVYLNNTVNRVDKPEKERQTVRAIDTLLNNYKEAKDKNAFYSMNTFISSMDYIAGIENARVDEERIKASCKITDKSWVDALESLENYPYFWGQVIAPLKWSMVNNVPDLKCFNKYAEKLKYILLANGQVHPLLRASLLCWYNYGSWRGKEHLLFLGEGNYHRDRSFKNMLRSDYADYGEIVKKVIDYWNKTCSNSTFEECFEILKKEMFPSILEDWRKVIILKPEVMQFSHNNILWYDAQSEHMFLREKLQENTQHREIFLAFLQCVCFEGSIEVIHDWYPEDANQNSLVFNSGVRIALSKHGKYEVTVSGTKNLLNMEGVIDVLKSNSLIDPSFHWGF